MKETWLAYIFYHPDYGWFLRPFKKNGESMFSSGPYESKADALLEAMKRKLKPFMRKSKKLVALSFNEALSSK